MKMTSEQFFLQVDGDRGHLDAGYEDLHWVVGIVEGGNGLFPLLIAVSGPDAEDIGIEDEHQDLHQPRGGRSVADQG